MQPLERPSDEDSLGRPYRIVDVKAAEGLQLREAAFESRLDDLKAIVAEVRAVQQRYVSKRIQAKRQVLRVRPGLEAAGNAECL
jgi:hypothetical protein